MVLYGMELFSKYSKPFLPFFAAGFLFFLAISLFGGLKKKTFQGMNPDFNQNAEVNIRELSFVQTETGLLSWSLIATEAAMMKKGQETHLENVSVRIPYGDDLTLLLKGDHGLVDVDQKAFALWKKTGLMTVDLQNGYTLQMAGLKWNESGREIISDGKALITGPKITVDGNLLKVSVDSQEMTVIGDVKAMVH